MLRLRPVRFKTSDRRKNDSDITGLHGLTQHFAGVSNCLPAPLSQASPTQNSHLRKMKWPDSGTKRTETGCGYLFLSFPLWRSPPAFMRSGLRGAISDDLFRLRRCRLLGVIRQLFRHARSEDKRASCSLCPTELGGDGAAQPSILPDTVSNVVDTNVGCHKLAS
jgi:hypothetical protein